MKIISGRINKPLKVVVYGPEGIGKSTFASQFPDPLFIDTEGSTNQLDVKRMENPESWAMMMAQVDYIKKNSDVCKTLVIDTADWAEKLAITDICAKYQVDGIEGFSWGKGYTYLEEAFGKFLNKLQDIVDAGVNVVITAHSQIRKFERPDEMGAYDRWELKLQKKISPLLKEWADMVLFANYKVIVTNVDNKGALKGKNKVTGGKRMINTVHTPAWDAKNRHGLEEELPFEFKSIAHIFDEDVSVVETVEDSEPVITHPVQDKKEFVEPVKEDEYDEIPLVENKELNQLLMANKVWPYEIQQVVSQKGYYPKDVEVNNYEDSFIKGVLIGAWDQVYNEILRNREEK